MLKIAIVCGGTGSIALQNGLAELLGRKNYQLDVIINAYDNGKSTGVCRRVYENRILGPSDLRKNHLTELSHKEGYANIKLLEFMNTRLSADSIEEYRDKAVELIEQYSYPIHRIGGEDAYNDFIECVHNFCSRVSHSFALKSESFRDFAVSNIFYADLAAQYDCSLSVAGSKLAKYLGIPDSVHLISDTSLMLGAETQSGKFIVDEGDIVSWDNSSDKIVRAVLHTPDTFTEYTPCVGEGTPQSRVRDVLREADLIILSAGTQWSSLIPTYMHSGFGELLQESKAKKYLVMNNTEDRDMNGCSASDLVRTISEYINLGKSPNGVKIVLNECAVESMRTLDATLDVCSISGRLGEVGAKTHDPLKLAQFILSDYMSISNLLDDSVLVSDLDGTLYNARGDRLARQISTDNLSMFDGVILSGNTYSHCHEALNSVASEVDIYCDYGNTHFTIQRGVIEAHIGEEYTISEGDPLLNLLRETEPYSNIVSLRGGAIIVLRPVRNRTQLMKKLTHLIHQNFGSYKYYASIAGSTTIDIFKVGFNKGAMLDRICKNRGITKDKVMYLGDELSETTDCLKGSNDRSILDYGFENYYEVSDVYEANNFLRVYNSVKK